MGKASQTCKNIPGIFYFERNKITAISCIGGDYSIKYFRNDLRSTFLNSLRVFCLKQILIKGINLVSKG